ncbi:hypothetical protein E4T56_gene6564, partial [Termitomyces sp. T112]
MTALHEAIGDTSGAHVSIDPRPFRAYGIEALPTYVSASSSYDLCSGEDCASKPTPFDRIAGNPHRSTGEHVDTSTVTGDPFYCGERKLGTWFYCERPKPKPSDTSASANTASPSYRQQLDKIGARLEELKAKAILEPTSDNIIAYV